VLPIAPDTYAAILTPGLERCQRAGDDGAKADESRVSQSAFVTLPALRQRVHTYTRRGAAPSMIRTFWRFGSKRRFVATIE